MWTELEYKIELLTEFELKMAEYWSSSFLICVFMDQDGVHKRGQYQASLNDKLDQ